MKKKRVIPILLLKNGYLVKSKNFIKHQNLGNPVTAVKRLSEWASDELIYLDITKNNHYDINRDDQNYSNNSCILDIILDVSKSCLMPITFGGGIKTILDIEKRLQAGADKVALNSVMHDNLHLISKASFEFGKQCIVISVDYKYINEKPKVFVHNGLTNTGYSPLEWVKIAEKEGAGEVLLNSIDRDGTQIGYDLDLIAQISNSVKIPVIAAGGAGSWEDMKEVFTSTKADAVAAANIFHFTDQSVYLAKKYLFEHKVSVRSPEMLFI